MSYNNNTTLNPQRSRSFRQFSREGFSPLQESYENTAYDNRQYGGGGNSNNNYGGGSSSGFGMGNPHDVESQAIPLENVASASGNNLRPMNSMTALRQQETAQSKTSSAKRRLFPRGRRHKAVPGGPTRPQTDLYGEEDALNAMGKVYHKILNFSVVTRYFLYVLPLAAIIAIPIIVGATHDSKDTIAGVPLTWFFVWIEIVWMSLWASKIVAHFMPFLFRFFIGVVSSGVRKYSLVITALEIPLSLVGWAVTSLATFVPLMVDNPTSLYWKDNPKQSPVSSPGVMSHWQTIVQEILGACVVASLLFLGEKFFIQLISINYHRKQFTGRIHESKRNVWLLGLLYDASRTLFPQYCNEFAEEDYAIADQLNISRGLGLASKRQSHHRTGSATPMRLIQNVGRVGDKLTSAFGNVAHEITGREVFNPNSAHSVVIEALERKRTSEALAKRIWMSFVVEGRDALTQEDIMDVLGDQHREEAEEAFTILDRDANGDVSLDEMILTVTEFSRERKAIANSMHDVDQAINVLDRMLLFCVFIGIVLVFIAFLVENFTTTLATAGTALLSLSFVFSVTAQEVLGSCIFLFVKHPYDIGDRVNIGALPAGLNGNAFVVEHISLLFTVFRHMQGLDCGQLCQIPNITLNTLWIENISRSKAMSEQFNINISFDTAFDDLQILKNQMLTFVTDKDNSRDFLPSVELDVLGTVDQTYLTLQVEIKHKSNWANETIRRARRSKFMCALIAALKTVPIYPPGGGADAAGSAANPTYSVAISDADAKKNAEGTANDRENARLVPSKKAISDDLVLHRSSTAAASTTTTGNAPFLTLRDEQIAEDLTSRNPDDGDADDSGSTLNGGGERPSVDRQDLEEVRGLLRRQSTRGKRKPYSSEYAHTVPTIYEPGSGGAGAGAGQQLQQPPSSAYGQLAPGAPLSSVPLSGSGYAGGQYQQQQQGSGYENERPLYSTGYAGAPAVRVQSPPQAQGQSIEMRQVAPPPPPPTSTVGNAAANVSRSNSNPYRPRGESMSTTRPFGPSGGGAAAGRGQGARVEEAEDESSDVRPYSGV